MKIIASTIQQLLITGVERLDPIRVMIEDFNLGQGRITITCWDDAWVNYWGAMGNSTMAEFFQSASTCYLAEKMKTGIEREICDEEALEKGCRAEVIKRRRERDLDKEGARDLWEEINGSDFCAHISENADLFYDVFGDDWWHALPQRPNPPYVYLCKVIDAVKAALRQHAEVQVAA